MLGTECGKRKRRSVEADTKAPAIGVFFSVTSVYRQRDEGEGKIKQRKGRGRKKRRAWKRRRRIQRRKKKGKRR